jgi:hypothetical protein
MKKIQYRFGISLLIACLIYVTAGCASSEGLTQTHNQTKITTTNKKTSKPKGLQLELRGVGDQYKPIFENHFSQLQTSFQNLIQDKGNQPEAIQGSRPDLSNATLIYDATNQRAEFVYSYSPKAEDLDAMSLQNMMWVKLGAYFFITQAVNKYFYQCKADLEKQMVPVTIPKMVVTFQVSDNDWLRMMSIAPYQLGLSVQLPDQAAPTLIQASLATATMVVAVNNPMKMVTAENSPEYSLTKFFHVNTNQLNQSPNNNHSVSATTPSQPEPNTDSQTTSAPSQSSGNNENNSDTISNVQASQSLIYTNSKYGFSLSLPNDWKGRYRVVEKNNKSFNRQYQISFDYVDQGTDYGDIFDINVYTDNDWASFGESAPEKRITSNKGITLSYMKAEQPSQTLLEPSHSSQLQQMQNMWGEVDDFIQKLTW